MFELLMKHGPLSRKELAAIIGMNDRSHSFSYALQQLNKLGFVESNGAKKLRLSDKAFLDPNNRPETTAFDQQELQKLMEKNSKPRASRKKKSKDESAEHEVDDSGDTKASKSSKKGKEKEGVALNSRLGAMVAILVEAEKFNQVVTSFENRSAKVNGKDILLDGIYFGLAMGFAANASALPWPKRCSASGGSSE